MLNYTLRLQPGYAFVEHEIDAYTAALAELRAALPSLPILATTPSISSFEPIHLTGSPANPEAYAADVAALRAAGWEPAGRGHTLDEGTPEEVACQNWTKPGYTFGYQLQIHPNQAGPIIDPPTLGALPTLGDLADLATIEHYEPDAGDLTD